MTIVRADVFLNRRELKAEDKNKNMRKKEKTSNELKPLIRK